MGDFIQKVLEVLFPPPPKPLTPEQLAAKQKQLRQSAKTALDRADRKAQELVSSWERKNTGRWENARKLLAAGQRSSAAAEIAKFRLNKDRIAKVENHRVLIDGHKAKVEVAELGDDLAVALGIIVEAFQIKPDKLTDLIAKASTALEPQDDIDSEIERLAEGEIERAMVSFSTSVPGYDELWKELESEVALGKVVTGEPSINADIATAREKIAKQREQGGTS